MEDGMVDFNPELETSTPDLVSNTSDINRFGSMDQYQQVVFDAVKSSLYQSGLKLTEYNQESVVGLLLQVSDEEDISPWSTWRSWMRRHLIPTLEMTKDEDFNKDIMRQRLTDLLGYVFMAFELVELDNYDRIEDAWARFRAMGIEVPK